MPLPRLQRVGTRNEPVLYSIGWGTQVTQGEVSRYQRGEASEFDPTIRLLLGVGGGLVRLAGLLRPLVHRRWAADVARANNLPESRLEALLFGVHRQPTTALRQGLGELQGGRCFYCDYRLGTTSARMPEIDHFIPWARHPENAIENLVLAHRSCNGWKRDFLACGEHVERWATRLESERHADLVAISDHAGWPSRPRDTVGVAAAIYLALPEDARQWSHGRDGSAAVDAAKVRAALECAEW